MLSTFFQKRNEALMGMLKSDAKVMGEALNACSQCAQEAVQIAKRERYAYEQKKDQLRREAEHLTKVYQSTVAPFQMLMSSSM